MRSLLKSLLPVLDLLLLPFVYPSTWVLKLLRRAGVHRLPNCRAALLRVGVFPIRNHYYEPQFDMRQLRRPLDAERPLPGIDWNFPEQLQLLTQMKHAHEVKALLEAPAQAFGFSLGNVAFESGDAEYWYQLIRLKKPRRIFEIGSGHSTLLAIQAVRMNVADDPAYACKHLCVEPFEMPWLEQTGVQIVRKKVEDLAPAFFAELEENDVLFIDSSHMIRPDGDVLFEYLELLPTLRPGVIVHVHDIFSPRNYPRLWLEEHVLFWNEQYLLEAFLTHNPNWKVIGALNALHHVHAAELQAVCPHLRPAHEPGSFYMQRVR